MHWLGYFRTRDIEDHLVELQIHLHQGPLHVRDMGCGVFHQSLALARDRRARLRSRHQVGSGRVTGHRNEACATTQRR